MASVAAKPPATRRQPPTPTEVSVAERIRRLAAEQLARHDDALRTADVRPGDPIEPVMAASRNLIEWTADVAASLDRDNRPLSAEAERHLAERTATLAGLALKTEARRFSRAIMVRSLGIAGSALVIAVAIGATAGYQWGARGSVVTMQVRPGEIVGHCLANTIQPAPDGNGRVCAAWVRLDQASLVGGVR